MIKLNKFSFISGLLILLILVIATPVWAGKENRGNTSSSPKVTVGNVDKVNSSSLIIENKSQRNKTEAVPDKNTKVIGQDNKALRLEKIKPHDLVAIISTDSGKANDAPGQIKKISKIFVRTASESAKLKRHAVQGIISSIEGNKITLVHQIQRERSYSFIVSAETVIKMKGIESPTISNLAVGQRVAAVGDLNSEGVIVAKRVHVIPGKAKGILEKRPLATPSATLQTSPTPSISISITPTITPIVSLTPTPTSSLSPTPTPTATVTP